MRSGADPPAVDATAPERGDEPILRAENLVKHYDTSDGFLDDLFGATEVVRAVDGVDLELYEGETLGIVGESGCGKTTLARTLLRLTEPTDGRVTYRGEDLIDATSRELRDLRTHLQYVFQDPYASLDPRLTVADIVGEPLDVHGIAAGEARQDRVYDLLETVGLAPSHGHRYPHEFSGGQRQRIGIARALAVDPEVLVCDEPVSALDVSVQAQILNLLDDLQDEFGLSYLFIAHDLSVVEHISDRIAVMYLGEFVEVGSTATVFEPPYHPYTEALLSAIPEPDPGWDGDTVLLPGTVPSSIDPPSGCRFHTRCPHVVQPEGHDLPQDDWRSIVDFALRLRDLEDLSGLTAVAAADDSGRGVDPSAASRDELDSLVREAFDIPDDLPSAADDAVSRALDSLHGHDLDGARTVLDEAFESPCEAERPGSHRTGDAHAIACHLYDDRFADARETSAPEGTDRATADD